LIVLSVLLRKRCHILRHVCLGINRVGGANGDAGTAIDAVYRIDIKLLDFRELGFIIAGMNAVYRTNLDTFFILCATFYDDE
jgi:hypothetical protein